MARFAIIRAIRVSPSPIRVDPCLSVVGMSFLPTSLLGPRSSHHRLKCQRTKKFLSAVIVRYRPLPSGFNPPPRLSPWVQAPPAPKKIERGTRRDDPGQPGTTRVGFARRKKLTRYQAVPSGTSRYETVRPAIFAACLRLPSRLVPVRKDRFRAKQSDSLRHSAVKFSNQK
jgi:hypothetical protein